jgi:hypothetical protein
MIVVPATVEHALRLDVQPHQRAHRELLRNPDYLAALFREGPVFAALDGERVLAIGGIHDHGAGVGRAYSWLAANLGGNMLGVHLATRRFLRTCEFRRLELVVAVGHTSGCRWAHLLGFRWESLMRSWMPDGSHANLYVKVRGWTP